VEVVGWGARVRCPLRRQAGLLSAAVDDVVTAPEREAYVDEVGMVPTPVRALGSFGDDEVVEGPALVEAAFTTVVVPKGAAARRAPSGSLVVEVA
jgi:N-methylhydantoinase A